MFKDLTFSGAARITSVRAERASDGFSDSSNGNWTYKLGANWAVNDWLRFRGDLWNLLPRPGAVRTIPGRRNQLPQPTRDRPLRAMGASTWPRAISRKPSLTTAPQIGIPSEPPWRRRYRHRRSHKAASACLSRRRRAHDGQRHPVAALRLPAGYADRPCHRLLRHQGEGRNHAARRTKHPVRMLWFRLLPGRTAVRPVHARSDGCSRLNVATVLDKFINIASQRNKRRRRHGPVSGTISAGSASSTSWRSMTWQTR